MKKTALLALSALFATLPAFAADTYNLDPSHTFPSFQADHMGGVSTFTGRFTKTSGTVTLDRAAKSGTLDVTIDANSLELGNEALTKHAKSPDMFNVEKFPTATYKGKITKYEGEAPSVVEGELTLLGVTKPVTLTIERFKCIPHPRLKRELCGAAVRGAFKRTDFGLNYGTPFFSADVGLIIQVEAIKAE